MNVEQRQLRSQRILVASAGGAYLCWWFFVRLSLPHAFNPLGSRLAAVACFAFVYAASYASSAVARHMGGWLAVSCTLATAHYFYLFDRNEGDLNWIVGSYITVMAVCAILQTARALLLYSLFVTALSFAMLLRHRGEAYVVFVPGMLTSLVFANVGLHGRLRLLARLTESYERIESLFDAGFDAIAVHEDGIVRQVNGTLGPLLGYTRDEVVGRNVLDLFPPEARERAAEIVAGTRRTPYEVDLLKKDGSRVTVEVIAKRHVLNRRVMQQIAFRDISEHKRAQEALVRANRDLESFSYSVAHDLRSPLRAINGFSKLLLEEHREALDAEGKRQLDRIATAAETMGRLIDALLGLARLTRKELQRETVDLSAQAEAVARQLRVSQPERVVTFEIQSGLTTTGDPQLLRALLDNLLGNAWKFTQRQPSPVIVLGSTVQEGVTVYFVKDNGAGFDMAHADKLFGPFQRLHAGSDFPGTGIGLATVQRIVDRHGGRVWAEGAVDQGATFYFTLQSASPLGTHAHGP